MAAQGTTMIKFLTDGVLLREMMDDPLLTKFMLFDFVSLSFNSIYFPFFVSSVLLL